MLGLLAALGTDAAVSEVLLIRHSGVQCERMECINEEETDCLQYQKDFYLYARGCPSTHTCSDCVWGAKGNDTQATTCRCEAKWFQESVGYNDRCDASKICSVGECFRPCDTFLQNTACPFPRCMWDTAREVPGCIDADASADSDRRLTSFPLSLEGFINTTSSLHFNGVLTSLVESPEDTFQKLDTNSDRSLSGSEFMLGLQDWLESATQKTREFQHRTRRRLVERRLAEGDATNEGTVQTADYCYRQGKLYCSFNQVCIDDCTLCGWHTATDLGTSSCVPSTPTSCLQEHKIYCASDDKCLTFGDCQKCFGRPIADYSQNQCLAPWWYSASAHIDSWVCRYRHKVGRHCFNDQDCVFGIKRCIKGNCASLRIKDIKDVCSKDNDCPHLGYYCPTSDDPSYVRICQPQKKIADKCAASTNTIECVPEARCNTAETPHKCRRLFSLPLDYPSSDPHLCTFGTVDAVGKCTVEAKSKSVSHSCSVDTDCMTTIEGIFGECKCKAWWDSEDSRYCQPVSGDYSNHMEKLRDYLWFVARNCGSFWDEDECEEEFPEARKLKYAFNCEAQELAGGPFLPHAACGLRDGTELVGRKWVAMTDSPMFIDYCIELKKMTRT